MICNPMVVKHGGGSKVYRITNNTSIPFSSSAEAGEYVTCYSKWYVTLSVKSANGEDIPTGVSEENTYYFVMPSSDVTITEGT